MKPKKCLNSKPSLSAWSTGAVCEQGVSCEGWHWGDKLQHCGCLVASRKKWEVCRLGRNKGVSASLWERVGLGCWRAEIQIYGRPQSTCRGRDGNRALIRARNGPWAAPSHLGQLLWAQELSMIDSTFCSWQELSGLLLPACSGGFTGCFNPHRQFGAGVLWVPLSTPRAEVTQHIPSEQPAGFSLCLVLKVAQKKSSQRQEGKFSQVTVRIFVADSCFVLSPKLPLYRNKLQTILTSLLPLNNMTVSWLHCINLQNFNCHLMEFLCSI